MTLLAALVASGAGASLDALLVAAIAFGSGLQLVVVLSEADLEQCRLQLHAPLHRGFVRVAAERVQDARKIVRSQSVHSILYSRRLR